MNNMKDITITVSAPVGQGKTIIAYHLYEYLRLMGANVIFSDPDVDSSQFRNMTSSELDDVMQNTITHKSFLVQTECPLRKSSEVGFIVSHIPLV